MLSYSRLMMIIIAMITVKHAQAPSIFWRRRISSWGVKDVDVGTITTGVLGESNGC